MAQQRTSPLPGRPVHQIINHLAVGDAIGHDCLTIQKRLRRLGHPSEIFALHVAPQLLGQAKAVSQYREFSSPDNLVIWHFSMGTEVSELVAGLPDRIVMRYHNVTPAHYFKDINPQAEMECLLGRQQLARAAGFVSLGIGDSAFNQAELDELGFRATGNCPILLDLESYRPAEPSSRLAHLRQGGPNILHVGRIVPQKRYDELIKTFFFLQRLLPEARLILVGGASGMVIYQYALEDLCRSLGLGRVSFTGFLTQKELSACYALSHVYLCLSEHEGFCVPLVEAMAMDLAVVAREAAAVGQTLGTAGVKLEDPSPSLTAEVVAEVATSQELRGEILAGQRARLADFQPDRVWERFYSLLGPLLAP